MAEARRHDYFEMMKHFMLQHESSEHRRIPPLLHQAIKLIEIQHPVDEYPNVAKPNRRMAPPKEEIVNNKKHP